jgi:hypothetical protein
MGRAAILDEQSHTAEVLVELFETGLPAMVWSITDVPGCVLGRPVASAGDRESYMTLVHCAERLGMRLDVSPPVPYSQSQGSCSDHSRPGNPVTPRFENYLITGVYHGVQLRCTGSAYEGTAEKTIVPAFRQARSPDPVVTAQIQALTVMIGLLSADLPPLSWRLRPENHEPQLSPEIHAHTYELRRQARAKLIQWADFLGIPIRYDPSSMYRFLYHSAEVTGHVDGVPITITARLRRPLSDTRPWRALRRQPTRRYRHRPSANGPADSQASSL